MARRARRLSMTSLIDVIFLLLLFFMLSSTFTRYGELPLAPDGPSGQAGAPPLFLTLDPDRLTLNGVTVPLTALAQKIARTSEAPALLLSLRGGVSAQRFADVLAVLRPLPDLRLSILTSS